MYQRISFEETGVCSELSTFVPEGGEGVTEWNAILHVKPNGEQFAQQLERLYASERMLMRSPALSGARCIMKRYFLSDSANQQPLMRQTDDEAAAPYEPLHASVMPITVEKVYSFDLPIAMTEADRKHVLGVQANLWSEYLYAPGVVEYHALPRMSALAEVQWSNTEDKSYEDFLKRMLVMRKIYDRYGWQYGKHIFRDPGTKIDRWNH